MAINRPPIVFYNNLSNFACSDIYVSAVWAEFKKSLTKEQIMYLSEYSCNPDSNLPPVFKLSVDQREKYFRVYDSLDNYYQRCARYAIGVPLPTDPESQTLIDAMNWIDDKVRHGKNGLGKRGFEWNFGITGIPDNLEEFAAVCLKYSIYRAESSERELESLKRGEEGG